MEQEKVDADVEQVKARRARDQDRMDQGLISNPKDLERMQHELESLERRITTLEDEELEVMERLEEAQQALDSLRGSSRRRRAAGHAGEARDRKVAEIDAELAGSTPSGSPRPRAGRPARALRPAARDKGGVGAAELRARQCGGCMLSLDNAELAVIGKGRATRSSVARSASGSWSAPTRRSLT